MMRNRRNYAGIMNDNIIGVHRLVDNFHSKYWAHDAFIDANHDVKEENSIIRVDPEEWQPQITILPRGGSI